MDLFRKKKKEAAAAELDDEVEDPITRAENEFYKSIREVTLRNTFFNNSLKLMHHAKFYLLEACLE